MNKKKLLLNIFCILMVFVLGFGLMHPVIASAGVKEDYESAQAALDKINKEIASLGDRKKKQQAARFLHLCPQSPEHDIPYKSQKEFRG